MTAIDVMVSTTWALQSAIGEHRVREARIDRAEAKAIRGRWQFGTLLLKQRDDRGRLPKGLVTDLVTRTGTSRREIRNREYFAATHPTENDVRDAVARFGSWDRIVADLTVRRRRARDGVL